MPALPVRFVVFSSFFGVCKSVNVKICRSSRFYEIRAIIHLAIKPKKNTKHGTLARNDFFFQVYAPAFLTYTVQNVYGAVQ